MTAKKKASGVNNAGISISGGSYDPHVIAGIMQVIESNNAEAVKLAALNVLSSSVEAPSDISFRECSIVVGEG